MTPTTKTIVLSDGREITLQTGKLAEQADGAVELRFNNTMLLATVCSAKEADEGVDFMPLTVEYKEKFSAYGRFPGGFTRREGRASDYEVLTARLVDRVLRPLFPSNYHANTIVHIIMFSSDGVDAPDALAGLAASAAIAVSDVPFEEPIAEVRVARINGEFVIDPTFEQIEQADMELMVGATYDNIMMVEGEMDEVSEDDLIAALKAAHEAIKPMCLIQKEMMAELGVTKREYCHETDDEELHERVRKEIYPKCYAVAQAGKADKQWRNETFQKAYDDFMETIPEEEREEKEPMIKRYYEEVQRDAVRRCILDEHIRLDGRKTNEIRPISCEPDYLPYPHGSALFKRGETQALATVTLGTKDDEKLIDDVLRHENERFLLHYNFPAFSTGEARAPRGVSRREIGHGNLAHRALKRMIPEDNPYCIRIVSDILSSNGSSSMATVCAGCMALLDAGVKMKKPVAGIAMGLITDEGNVKHAVLSDILGDEDHLGDMDFKVTGTVDGITATQMDIKCDGLPYEILEQALHQAKEGRLHILNLINEAIPAPREDYKPHVPRIVTMVIDKEFIGAVIGKGGEVIQGTRRASKLPLSASRRLLQFPRRAKFTPARWSASLNSVPSLNSCLAVTVCCTSAKSAGTVLPTWRPLACMRVTWLPSSSLRLTRRPASSVCRCAPCRKSPRVMTSVAKGVAPVVPVAMVAVMATVAAIVVPVPAATVVAVLWVAAIVVPDPTVPVVLAVMIAATTSKYELKYLVLRYEERPGQRPRALLLKNNCDYEEFMEIDGCMADSCAAGWQPLNDGTRP